MKHTIKGYVSYRTESYLTDGERIHWSRYDPRLGSSNKDVFIREQPIEIELPDDFDPRPAQVIALREEQQKLRAAMAKRIKELDDQINSLLALEMGMTKKMNPEIKAQWLSALRSGKYKQGSGELRSYTDSFCCLGVLCDLRDSGKWVPHPDSEYGPYGYEFSADYDYPPGGVSVWAGLDWHNTNVVIDGVSKPLADHNDQGATFAQIADAIEAQL